MRSGTRPLRQLAQDDARPCSYVIPRYRKHTLIQFRIKQTVRPLSLI